MEISVRKINDTFILDVSGSLDIYTATDFKQKIDEFIEVEEKTILINMEHLKYIDSSGIGILIKQMNLIKSKNKNFMIANLKKQILKVFSVAGLTSYFEIMTNENYHKLTS